MWIDEKGEDFRVVQTPGMPVVNEEEQEAESIQEIKVEEEEPDDLPELIDESEEEREETRKRVEALELQQIGRREERRTLRIPHTSRRS